MKKILIIASLFCLLACQHKQENKIEKINCRTIAVDSLTDLPEQKIKQIRYIPLETNDDICLVILIQLIMSIISCIYLPLRKSWFLIKKGNLFMALTR